MSTLAVKTPEEVKFYVFDVKAWMDALDTTISSVDLVSADPAGLTVVLDGNTSNAIQVKVSDGTAGERYKVRAQFQTGDGQTLTADIFIPVENQKG